jgi:hypothetical protein
MCVYALTVSSVSADLCRSHTRTIRVELPIAGVVKRLGVGAANTIVPETESFQSVFALKDKVDLSAFQLYIDGERAEPKLRTVAAVNKRIAGFVADVRTEGSVGYSYTVYLPERGVYVQRETLIKDNYMRLDTKLTGDLRSVSWVTVVIEAWEESGSTLIRGTITAYVPLRGGRIAHCVGRGIMDKRLAAEGARIEGKGRALAANGEAGLLSLIRTSIDRIRSR